MLWLVHHIFLPGPLSMVYEFLKYYFVPYDYVSGFDLFFKVCGHIALGHIPPSVSCLFFAFRFLTLEK
jgi:hypothetical protein